MILEDTCVERTRVESNWRCVVWSEHETAIVELERRQLTEKHQLEEKQLKEKFILQRQLMMTRQAKVSDVTVFACYVRPG